MRPIETIYIVSLEHIWLYLDRVLHFYLKNEHIPMNFDDAGKAIIDRALSEALYYYTYKYFSINRYWHDSLTVTFDIIKTDIVPYLIQEFNMHKLSLQEAKNIDYLITRSTLILNVNRGFT